MGVEAVSAGLAGVALTLACFGIIFSALAIVAARSLGPRGALLVWLVTTCNVSMGVGYGPKGTLKLSGTQVLSFFLVPFLFLFVQLGLVSLYVGRSTQRGTGAAQQFLLSLLVFVAAVVPATAIAVIPDVVQFFVSKRV
jgi:hypothetical protein